MAITTYAELQTAVSSWLDRSDLASKLPDFITLAENGLDRTLRARQLIVRATADLNEPYENLPTDFAQEIRLYISNVTPTVELKYMSPNALIQEYRNTEGGTPRAYSILGSQLQFAPVPDVSGGLVMELTYYKKVSSIGLSVTNTTNVILDSHPDVYLYSVLSEAASFLMDDKATQRFVSLREAAVQRANEAAEDATFGGALIMSHGLRGDL